VSPVDGRVNCFGEVLPGGLVDQIKGMSYRVEDLLGHPLPPPAEGSKMYYYVLYLAPGDYHRMHAPFECTVEERRHFPGALYPVAPSIARYIPSLFVRNERVVLSGAWKHGFMALVPVGAYNVGSMKLTFDDELDTNLRAHTFTQYRPNLEDGLQSKPFYRSYKKAMRAPLGESAAASSSSSQQLQQQQPGPLTQPASVVPAPRSVAQLQRDVVRATDEFVKSDPAIDPHTFSATNRPWNPSGKSGAGGLSPADRTALGAPSAQVGQEVMRVTPSGIHLDKGAEFARFELGSTIVVLFQLDKGQQFNFNVEPEQKVKLGQRMGVIVPPSELERQKKPPVDNSVVVLP